VTVAALLAQFEELVERQVPRLERLGLRAWAALGVHPAVLPRRGLEQVLDVLPRYFRTGKVVAVGLIGLAQGGAAEEAGLKAQLELAESWRLPVLLTTPKKEREKLTRRVLALLTEFGFPPERALVEGATAKTIGAIHALGFHAGLTLQSGATEPEKAVPLVKKLGPERLHLMSGVGHGEYDLLALPRTVHLLRKAELSRAVVGRVAGRNAARWLGLPLE
jgi:predicted metal-dependent TIM-barrel fold hydrolase